MYARNGLISNSVQSSFDNHSFNFVQAAESQKLACTQEIRPTEKSGFNSQVQKPCVYARNGLISNFIQSSFDSRLFDFVQAAASQKLACTQEIRPTEKSGFNGQVSKPCVYAKNGCDIKKGEGVEILLETILTGVYSISLKLLHHKNLACTQETD
ncbi:hypothetical protein [Acinetobacter sp. P1(2025)]|uniref:hypothetical protein n=1 Tax=Acinetobacter sp. P1(2025) TaxID=3446120 RepID=UPI003F5343FA